jgi:hypothetical protein
LRRTSNPPDRKRVRCGDHEMTTPDRRLVGPAGAAFRERVLRVRGDAWPRAPALQRTVRPRTADWSPRR